MLLAKSKYTRIRSSFPVKISNILLYSSFKSSIVLLAFTFIFIFPLAAQKKIDKTVVTKVYTVDEMHKELDIIESKISKFHPDPFHYISKDSLHLFVQDLKKQINTPLTDIKFRFYARQIVARVGCGHTSLIPSKAYLKAIDSVKRNVFPVDVWLTDTNRVFVKHYLHADSLLHRGDEIISINEIPVEHVLKKIYASFPSDGLNETYKKQSLQADRFRYFYAAAYAYDTLFTVNIRKINGENQTVKVRSISSFADTLKPKSNKRYTILYKNTKAQFKIDEKDPHLAILDINNFGGKKWRKLMRLSFRYLRQHPEVTSLAIDLRDNGGGNVSKGNNLLTYLLPKTFTFCFGRKPNLLPLNPSIKMNVGSRITPVSFLIYPLSFVRHKKWTHWFIKFPKTRNHFKGQLYVITNGRSFSMSVVTSAYLKYKANATIIGEETGGTQCGSNAMLNGKIILPVSKSQLTIPLYRIDHSINAPDTKRGLMPDYPVYYNINDLLKGTDLEMEKIRSLIQENKAALR